MARKPSPPDPNHPAYQEGHAAGRSGGRRNSNPYSPSDPEARNAWMLGWLDGRAQLLKGPAK
jgi:ribosome modulation factor